MTIFDVISAKKKHKAELEEVAERLKKVKAHGETMDESDFRPQGDDSRSMPQKTEEEAAAELQKLRDKQKKRGK